MVPGTGAVIAELAAAGVRLRADQLVGRDLPARPRSGSASCAVRGHRWSPARRAGQAGPGDLPAGRASGSGWTPAQTRVRRRLAGQRRRRGRSRADRARTSPRPTRCGRTWSGSACSVRVSRFAEPVFHLTDRQAWSAGPGRPGSYPWSSRGLSLRRGGLRALLVRRPGARHPRHGLRRRRPRRSWWCWSSTRPSSRCRSSSRTSGLDPIRTSTVRCRSRVSGPSLAVGIS